MISTINEYLKLKNSEDKRSYDRVISEELTPELISDILENYPEEKPWLVHNKFISIEILRILALDKDVDVRFTVAMKKKCDRFIFETLMKDKEFSVRMAVVRNNKLPVDLLETLTSDYDNEIAKEAKRMLKRRIMN